jgi:hypothetical protein
MIDPLTQAISTTVPPDHKRYGRVLTKALARGDFRWPRTQPRTFQASSGPANLRQSATLPASHLFKDVRRRQRPFL